MKVGVVPAARSTFDVDYAEEVLAAALDCLARAGYETIGPRALLFDLAAVDQTLDRLASARIEAILVLQTTFTDGTLATRILERTKLPVVFWSFPEPREGGRLRLNSLCGVNLAAHVARRRGRHIFHLHAAPTAEAPARIEAVVTAARAGQPTELPPVMVPRPSADTAASQRARAAAVELRNRVVGRIGDHPTGFDPCAYDRERLTAVTGMDVDHIELPELFSTADATPGVEVARIRHELGSRLEGIDDLDPVGVERSLRLYTGMRRLADERGWSGVATRCWPECFTEYGGAACTPHALLGEAGVPGTCEADVYGNVTAQILDAVATGPSVVVDLVDADDDTVAFWHCGLAPLPLAHPDFRPRATVHSNRHKPLLNEFPFRPGRITIARLSQAGGDLALTIGGAEMLDRPLPFSGTSGVARPDVPVAVMLDRVVGWGLEHHYGLVYGDVREELRELAAQWNLPVMDLTGEPNVNRGAS